MNIKLLFELFKDFFESIYSPFIEDVEEEIFNDEEKGWREFSHDE